MRIVELIHVWIYLFVNVKSLSGCGHTYVVSHIHNTCNVECGTCPILCSIACPKTWATLKLIFIIFMKTEVSTVVEILSLTCSFLLFQFTFGRSIAEIQLPWWGLSVETALASSGCYIMLLIEGMFLRWQQFLTMN